jgi:serine phosphatase RsbU (regulator of sigma subunit)
MKFRFTIGRKIGLGFGVLIITTLGVYSLTIETLSKGREANDNINNIYNPSVFALERLKSSILRSKTLISMWALVQSREDTKEKISLREVITKEIPSIKQEIDTLSFRTWQPEENRHKEKIYKQLDELMEVYAEVQNTFTDMKSYDQPYARFAMGELVEEDGQIDRRTQEIIAELNDLINVHRENRKLESQAMITNFDDLEVYLYLGLGVCALGILIAILTARSIVLPVRKLKETLILMGKGKFPEKAIMDTGDEVGEMSLALEQLVQGMRRTTEFSNQVGEGNYDMDYEPLSDEDRLGKALLVMREELKKRDADYRKQVEERTKEIREQKEKIEEQNEQRKELLENITASIKYARRLQENILPSSKRVRELLPDSFIYFRPKDIVSGDFYFVNQYDGKVVFAAVDCTGHGVPGAFMSLVGHNALNQAIRLNPELDPASILKTLNKLSAKALNVNEAEYKGRDGMDLAFCVYDPESGVIEYSGAHNPLYLVRNQKLITHKPDKISIGSPEQIDRAFSKSRIELEKGDMIYIFSDGYVDQFGGEKGKKFMYGPFRELLISISDQPSDVQLETLDEALRLWQHAGGKEREQVDDILVMGVRYGKD